jgi:magnesium and cobalt transporter
MSDDKPPSTSSQRRRWVDRISQLFSGEPQDLEDLLDILREAKTNRLLDTDALSMIEGVLQFNQMQVRDIMIPRVQMVVVPNDAELDTILPLVTEFNHSRYPVIDGDRSKVVGILLAKDLLGHLAKHTKFLVKDIMRPAYVVPESKRLNVLLKELRTNGNHMAIVVDEYGQTAGLVSIEDVLEQAISSAATTMNS